MNFPAYFDGKIHTCRLVSIQCSIHKFELIICIICYYFWHCISLWEITHMFQSNEVYTQIWIDNMHHLMSKTQICSFSAMYLCQRPISHACIFSGISLSFKRMFHLLKIKKKKNSSGFCYSDGQQSPFLNKLKSLLSGFSIKAFLKIATSL